MILFERIFVLLPYWRHQTGEYSRNKILHTLFKESWSGWNPDQGFMDPFGKGGGEVYWSPFDNQLAENGSVKRDWFSVVVLALWRASNTLQSSTSPSAQPKKKSAVHGSCLKKISNDLVESNGEYRLVHWRQSALDAADKTTGAVVFNKPADVKRRTCLGAELRFWPISTEFVPTFCSSAIKSTRSPSIQDGARYRVRSIGDVKETTSPITH